MRRQLFSLVVLVTLGLLVVITAVLVQPELLAGLAPRATAGHISEHFRDPQHRVHDLTFGLLLAPTVLGTLAQLRRPRERAAAQWMALVPIAALTLAASLSSAAVLSFPWVSVGALVVGATLLHPTVGELLRSLRTSHTHPTMLALIALATGPWLVFGATNLELQRRGAGDHALLGHYGFMAAFGFTVLGLGLLSSLRPRGWGFIAQVAGALSAGLGVASLAFPDVESRLDLSWALAAIGWGVFFVLSGAEPRLRVLARSIARRS